MHYAVSYILYGGVKIVKADSEEEATKIVQEMSDDELMEGAYMDDVVQDVELVDAEEYGYDPDEPAEEGDDEEEEDEGEPKDRKDKGITNVERPESAASGNNAIRQYVDPYGAVDQAIVLDTYRVDVVQKQRR